jgi:uncharacterized protein with NAD-binding domain and iron-sulfur cluster
LTTVASASADGPGVDQRTKVAVLGGGAGAIAAAFELTRAENRDQYEVTVYQMGWRLGGKGASGRGPDDRIEEHGLHVWFGFYENAFRCLRECYGELGRGPEIPIRDVDEAFLPASLFGVAEEPADRWSVWTCLFPDNEGEPGTGPLDETSPTLASYVVNLLRLMEALVTSLRSPHSPLRLAVEPFDPAEDSVRRRRGPGGLTAGDIEIFIPPATATTSTLIAAARSRARNVREAVDTLEIEALVAALELASTLEYFAEWTGQQLSTVSRLVDVFADSFNNRVADILAGTPEGSRLIEVVDAAATIVRGLIEDEVVMHDLGLSALDNFDLRDWMYLHGARQTTLDGGLLRGIYDLVFAYRDGDRTRPSLAASNGLRGMFRMFFGYRGSFAYRMLAGMGDVVFAPYYQALVDRGVKFEFFHEVTSLVPSRDRRRIEEVEIAVQAETEGGKPYLPLVPVKGLPCWPAEPIWGQLGGRRRRRAGNFEYPSVRSPRAGEKRLQAGIDFDWVVFGLSLGSVPGVCERIVEQNGAWADAVEKVATVPTQALQIWLTQSTSDLGGDPDAPVVSGYVEPFDTWADMSHLLPLEGWKADPPKSIHYFCSVLAGSAELPKVWPPRLPGDKDREVAGNSERFLADPLALWLPDAVDKYPPEFRQELLRASYVRANVAPSERYVQSLPGTEQYRLRPDESGYDNLVLAGDWTWTPLNSGCVEAATMSGLLAARAIMGSGPEGIVGHDHP